jgi:hypothetical protein
MGGSFVPSDTVNERRYFQFPFHLVSRDLRPFGTTGAGWSAHSDDRDHSFRSIATTCSERSRPV